MIWTAFPFGKYINLTAPQIAFRDPDYLYWADETVRIWGDLRIDVHTVATRASNIRVLPLDGEDRMVEYIIDQHTGRFVTVEFTLASDGPGPMRSRAIDLSLPRRFHTYDKLGGRNLVAAVKEHLFGSKRARITKERAEGFFDDETNFLRSY
jgi:hypothetical protein